MISIESCLQEAFWCLVQISEQYLPGYYSPLLVSTQLFFNLSHTKKVYMHAGKFSLEGLGLFVVNYG